MRNGTKTPNVVEAVRHPVRARILEVLHERDMSPVRFVNRGHADFYFGQRPTVSHVAYHFRELVRFGCLEEVSRRPSRGSVETIYRTVVRGEFEEEDWVALSDERKRELSRVVAQGLIARVDGALKSETFDSRDDRQLAWFALRLDERGWREAGAILADAFASLTALERDSAARLAGSGEAGMTATAGLLLFESPSPVRPVLADPGSGA
jgi:hypothetical protein